MADSTGDDPPTIINSRSIMSGSIHDNNDSSQNRGIDGSQVGVMIVDEDDDGNVAVGYQPDRLIASQSPRTQANDAAQHTHGRSDEEALAYAVADAGLNSFGCVFVEVWAMSDE